MMPFNVKSVRYLILAALALAFGALVLSHGWASYGGVEYVRGGQAKLLGAFSVAYGLGVLVWFFLRSR
jgi:hypothetical protein